MKKVFIAALVFLSINTFAQSANDSAYIKNVTLEARLTAVFSQYANNSSNDSLFTVFIKWRSMQRSNFATGTATITLDSIPTVELAAMYNYIKGLPGGLGFMSFLSLVNPLRASNPYFDRLCTAYDQAWTAKTLQFMLDSYKLQRGRY